MLHTTVFPSGVKWYSQQHPVMPFAVGLILKMQIACQEVFLIIQVWAKSHMIQRVRVWFMSEILFYVPLLTHFNCKTLHKHMCWRTRLIYYTVQRGSIEISGLMFSTWTMKNVMLKPRSWNDCQLVSSSLWLWVTFGN